MFHSPDTHTASVDKSGLFKLAKNSDLAAAIFGLFILNDLGLVIRTKQDPFGSYLDESTPFATDTVARSFISLLYQIHSQ